MDTPLFLDESHRKGRAEADCATSSGEALPAPLFCVEDAPGLALVMMGGTTAQFAMTRASTSTTWDWRLSC